MDTLEEWLGSMKARYQLQVESISLRDVRNWEITEDEIVLLTAFADQASLALEKARLLNEAETERERADSLYRVSNLLASAYDTDEVLDLIVNEASKDISPKTKYPYWPPSPTKPPWP